MMKKSTNMTRQVEEKAIEEMAKLCPFYEEGKCLLLEEDAVECDMNCDMCRFAKTLYNADYRKQSENTIDLPCKVGDTVYVLTTDSPTGIEETKISQVVVRVKRNCKMSYTILAPCVYDDWGKAKWSFCDNDFGKTVFFTREEAEKALTNMKGGKQNVSL